MLDRNTAEINKIIIKERSSSYQEMLAKFKTFARVYESNRTTKLSLIFNCLSDIIDSAINYYKPDQSCLSADIIDDRIMQIKNPAYYYARLLPGLPPGDPLTEALIKLLKLTQEIIDLALDNIGNTMVQRPKFVVEKEANTDVPTISFSKDVVDDIDTIKAKASNAGGLTKLLAKGNATGPVTVTAVAASFRS
jgi:hypothetical protein